MKKIIIAQLSIHKNETNVFLMLAKTMVAQSNAEKGCITYRLLEDVHSENDFLIYEEYKSEKDVEAHNSSTHFTHFFNAVVPLLSKEPKIESH